MSVYIGGDVLASKNLWKINDALDTIEGSVLVEGISADVDHLQIDGSGNIYASANDSGYGVWKYSSALALDTSWGTSGEIDPPGNDVLGLSVSVEGKVATGTAAGISHFDSEGNSLWAAEDGFDYFAVLIDPKTKNVLGYDQDSPRGLRKFGKLDGTILESGTVGSAGSASCSGLVIDRTNYTNPAQVYLHELHNTTRNFYAFDPDNLSNRIYKISSSNFLPTNGRQTLAVDSSGNIYMVGGRKTGGFGGEDYSVVKIDPSDGSILDVYDTGADTQSIAIDSDDNIFVTDSEILRFNTAVERLACSSKDVFNFQRILPPEAVPVTKILSSLSMAIL